MSFTSAKLLLFVCCNILSVAMAHTPVKCQGMEVKLCDAMMEVISNCLSQQGIPRKHTGIPDDKEACYGKCLFTHNNVTGDGGIPNMKKINTIVNSSFPKETAAAFAKGVEKCVDDFGRQIQPSEKNCDSYKQIAHCAIENYATVCVKAKASPS